MKLQLGFEDIPYAARYSKQSPLTATVKKRKPKTLSPIQQAYGQGKTVGEVAKDIEKKYGVVETFYNLEENYIVDNLERSFKDSIEIGIMKGSWDVAWDPTPLQGKFRRSLTGRRFDGLIRGVPTRAATRGISHLRRKPTTSVPRPSFVNTGLYMRSFKAWMEK